MNPLLTLCLGLALFLGTHSIRIFADDWRTAMVKQLGEWPWKGIVAVVSLAGFYLLVTGFGAARLEPVVLWASPTWMRHLVALLTIPAFILAIAAYVPGNLIKARIGHPLLAATKIWALAHLMANGRLADVLLFGSFLLWAAFCFRSARRRDKAEGRSYPVGALWRTLVPVFVGLAVWGDFAMHLHGVLIGVRPFR